jgi:ribosomal protein S18 acetylase RimI-like enzyme
VREDHQGQGIDSALFDAAVELLAECNPKSLWTCVREDFVHAPGYLRERRYEEQFRSRGAHLDLARFNPKAFDRYRDSLVRQGIELHTYAEL